MVCDCHSHNQRYKAGSAGNRYYYVIEFLATPDPVEAFSFFVLIERLDVCFRFFGLGCGCLEKQTALSQDFFEIDGI